MDTVEKVEVVVTDQEKARQERIAARPALSEILNLHDFEVFLYLIYSNILHVLFRLSPDRLCLTKHGHIILQQQMTR